VSVNSAPDLSVARRLLEAADSDIVAFFDFFADETVFRMANSDAVVGKDDIRAWVGRYLGAVWRECVTRSSRSSTTRTPPPCASMSRTP
jgi:hypothetical protein